MGRHWTGPTLSEQSYLFQGNLLLSITAMSQDVCASDWSMILKRSAPSPPYTFSKCPHNLFNLFLSKWQFSDKKVWSFETNVLIDNWFLPTCPGIRRNICLICVRCRLLLSCPGDRFEVSFLATKSIFVQSCHILMGWLWTTLVVFIWQKHMHNEAVVFPFGKQWLWGFKFVTLEPFDWCDQFYLEKTLKIVQSCPIWRY